MFGIPFKTIKIPKCSIYLGCIDDLQITLCPASMADIKAKDNRHQLTFLMDDIKNTIEKTKRYGGSIMQEIEETENVLQAAIRDVDGNSIVLKQTV